MSPKKAQKPFVSDSFSKIKLKYTSQLWKQGQGERSTEKYYQLNSGQKQKKKVKDNKQNHTRRWQKEVQIYY